MSAITYASVEQAAVHEVIPADDHCELGVLAREVEGSDRLDGAVDELIGAESHGVTANGAVCLLYTSRCV